MSFKGKDKSDKKVENARFEEGEKILCYHGPLIYEAKCLNVKKGDDGKIEYYIHYSGWNKNWDEWATDDRLLKWSEENIEQKKKLQNDQKLQKKKSSKRRTSVGSGGEKEDSSSRSNSPKLINSRRSIAAVSSKSSVPSSAPIIDKQDLNRKKKDVVPSPVSKMKYWVYCEKPEAEYFEHITINIQIPEDLKFLLLYDYELICRKKKITKVPARVSIDEITEKYILHKVKVTDLQLASKFKETAYALKRYFNTVIFQKLLYPFEKPQFNKLVETKSNFVPSAVYGVAQFTRLFVKIGHLLAHLQLDDFGSNSIEENINDYVRYLNLNISKFINIDDYQGTSSDYQRKVKELYKSRETD